MALKEPLERIVDRAYDWMTEHPKTIGAVSGVSMFSALELYHFFVNATDFYHFLFPATGVGAAILTHILLKGNKILKDFGIEYKGLRNRLKPRKKNRRTDSNRWQKLADPLFENSGYSGLGLIALISADVVVESSLKHGFGEYMQMVFSNHNNLLYFYSALFTVGVYAAKKWFDLTGVFLHSSNNFNSSKYMLFQFERLCFGDKAVYNKYKDKICQTDFNPLVSLYAEVCASQKKIDEALDVLRGSVFMTDGSELQPSSSKTPVLLEFKSYMLRNYKRMTGHPESFDGYVGLALNFLSLGETEAAVSVIRMFPKAFENGSTLHFNAGLAVSLFLAELGEDSLFSETIKKLLSDYNVHFEPIENYNVLSISDTEFSNHTFRFRVSGDESSLQDDIKFSSDIKGNFDDSNDDPSFEFAVPLSVFRLGDSYYSPAIYKSGEQVYERVVSLPVDERVGLLKDIARFLARIHGSNSLYDPVEPAVYLEDLRKRADSVDLNGQRPYVGMFLDHADVLVQGFGSMSRFVDVDAHLWNWIIGEKGYVKIDNQFRRPTIPSYEVSKMLEQGEILPADKGFEDDRIGVMKEYYFELPSEKRTFSFDELYLKKLQADPLKAFSFCMFALSSPRNPKIVSAYLKNAVFSVGLLKREFTSAYEQSGLENIQKSLEGLLA